jgi:hypothetical protein
MAQVFRNGQLCGTFHWMVLRHNRAGTEGAQAGKCTSLAVMPLRVRQTGRARVVARILTIADGRELRILCRNGQQGRPLSRMRDDRLVEPTPTHSLPYVRSACSRRARGRRDEAASGSFATGTRVLAAYDALTTG